MNKILTFREEVEWTKSHGDFKSFGNNETNDITIGRNHEGDLEEMSLRIDVRNIDRKFVDESLIIAKELDCLLLDTQGNLFEPIPANLSNCIKTSDAFRFVTDPKDFLDKLEKK